MNVYSGVWIITASDQHVNQKPRGVSLLNSLPVRYYSFVHFDTATPSREMTSRQSNPLLSRFLDLQIRIEEWRK